MKKRNIVVGTLGALVLSASVLPLAYSASAEPNEAGAQCGGQAGHRGHGMESGHGHGGGMRGMGSMRGLDLTEAQRGQFAQMRAEMQAKMLSVLTPEQRKTVDERMNGQHGMPGEGHRGRMQPEQRPGAEQRS